MASRFALQFEPAVNKGEDVCQDLRIKVEHHQLIHCPDGRSGHGRDRSIKSVGVNSSVEIDDLVKSATWSKGGEW